jgi:hypothetical protein
MGDSSNDLEAASREILDGLSTVGQKIQMPTALDDAAYRLSLRDTTLAMFNEFGGASGVANLLRQAFTNAPGGSAAQATILNMILRGLERYGDEDVQEDSVSMEGLEKELNQLFLEDLLEQLSEETAAAVMEELG